MKIILPLGVCLLLLSTAPGHAQTAAGPSDTERLLQMQLHTPPSPAVTSMSAAEAGAIYKQYLAHIGEAAKPVSTGPSSSGGGGAAASGPQ